MSTKIDHSTSSPVLSGGGGVPPAAARSGAVKTDVSSVQNGASDDTVHLTGDAMQLQDLDKLLSQSPSVNVKKVAELRSSIANGQYKVNSESVAAKLLGADRVLGKH
jgi:negative regulator of flagellin synthesis FlgM